MLIKKQLYKTTFFHIWGQWLQIYAGNNDFYRAGPLHAANLHKLKIFPTGKQIFRKTVSWLADLDKNTRDLVSHLWFFPRGWRWTSQGGRSYWSDSTQSHKTQTELEEEGRLSSATVSSQPSHLPSLSWSRNAQKDFGLLVRR